MSHRAFLAARLLCFLSTAKCVTIQANKDVLFCSTHAQSQTDPWTLTLSHRIASYPLRSLCLALYYDVIRNPFPLPLWAQFRYTDAETSTQDHLPYTDDATHMYKLFKKSNSRNIRTTFFCERVINIWNKLPANTDFSSLVKFKRCIASMDFSVYLQCF